MRISTASLWLMIGLCACGPSSRTLPEKNYNMTLSFKTPEWTKQTSIYEVNVRQYTPAGTFTAFLSEMPRLRDMGVGTLWFMPITPIAQKNRKGTLGSYYACSDYTSINPEFGTLDDFKQLVQQAHALGMKVIIDWVANHTGWDHRWTREHPDYYQKDSLTGDFKIASGMDDIIELDFTNPVLRKAMIEAMQFWVEECDIDGFRCDLAFWVELPFWREARYKLDAVKPLFWFGEYDELEKPEYAEVFDASYTWTWMHRAKDFYQQQGSMDSLLLVLDRYTHLPNDRMRSWFTTNHDENSWNGTEFEKYGDMARGLAVFSATWPGVPLIYSGQEKANVSRIKFFDKDTIRPGTDAESFSRFYSALLQLKKTNAALKADSAAKLIRLRTTAPGSVLAFLRTSGDSSVLVVLNLSSQSDLRFEINDDQLTGRFRDLLSQSMNDFTADRSFLMQPWDYLIYTAE
ncbi:MAG: alpha-amylase family glycosyl hydrolase [Bacteroidota bacterium]